MKKNSDNELVDSINRLIPYRNNLGMIKEEWIQEIVSYLTDYEAIGIVDIAGESLVFRVNTEDDKTNHIALKVALPHMQLVKKDIFLYSAFNFIKRDKSEIQRRRFYRGGKLQDEVEELIKEKNEKSFIVPKVIHVNKEPLYMTMKFIKSIGVLRHIKERKSLAVDFEVFLNILNAVLFLHTNGIVHRDLKSENIMIWKDNRVVLLDFNTAKKIDDKSLTLFGTVKGTHLSPHIMSGEFANFSFVDDILALGFIFYEFWTKKRVKEYLKEEDLVSLPVDEIIRKYKEHRRELSEDLPPGVKEIFLKATHPDETKRYQFIHMFRADVIKLKEHLEKKAAQKKGVKVKINKKTTNREEIVDEYLLKRCKECRKEWNGCSLRSFCRLNLIQQLDFYIYLKKRKII